jgi:hypothetical protein
VSTKINPKLPPRIVRSKIAAQANVDERAVKRFFTGAPTLHVTKIAIVAAMQALDLSHLAPAEQVQP